MSEDVVVKPSGNLVVVGCKLPSGLICELGRPGDDKYQQVKLNGANSSRIIGGYGMTKVPKDFIESWLKKNAKLVAVKNGLIFTQADSDNAEAQALDSESLRTGFEPLDDKKLPKGLEKA